MRYLTMCYLTRYLVILLIFTNLYSIYQYNFIRYAQIGQIQDAFNVYRWAIADSKNSDNPRQIISHLVYVYSYYPTRTKYISSTSPLDSVMEQGREQTILLIVQILQNKVNTDIKNDLDTIVDTFGDEETRYSYESMKMYREEHNLPPILINKF